MSSFLLSFIFSGIIFFVLGFVFLLCCVVPVNKSPAGRSVRAGSVVLALCWLVYCLLGSASMAVGAALAAPVVIFIFYITDGYKVN